MRPEKPTILYIDDEEDNLIVFRSAFRRDFNVLVSTSPKEGLAMATAQDIPLVITDQRMPGMTGIEFLEKLPENNESVRMILTGFSDVEIIIQAINKCNIYRYLTKPWDKGELMHTMNLALEKFYLNRENEKLLEDLKVANEELEERVKIRTAELEQEKERANQLLLNVLPKAAADELKKRGKVKPRLRKDVTILFMDIVHFTKIAEQNEPEDLIEELDYYFKVFDTIFSKYGVEKIKTIGDAYMAACGLHEDESDHAEKVIRAAKDVLAFIEAEKKHRSTIGRTFFELRVGIHSGEVITGIVGHTKFAFDIWGDDVNIAARLEQAGTVNQINISEATYDLVKDKFEFESRGKIKAKYKGEMDMYFVK
jgi:class 3 adenylate cyclase